MRGINRQGELLPIVGENNQIFGPRMYRGVFRMIDHVPVAARKRDSEGKVFG
jgi:hypothetical protein